MAKALPSSGSRMTAGVPLGRPSALSIARDIASSLAPENLLCYHEEHQVEIQEFQRLDDCRAKSAKLAYTNTVRSLYSL